MDRLRDPGSSQDSVYINDSISKMEDCIKNGVVLRKKTDSYGNPSNEVEWRERGVRTWCDALVDKIKGGNLYNAEDNIKILKTKIETLTGNHYDDDQDEFAKDINKLHKMYESFTQEMAKKKFHAKWYCFGFDKNDVERKREDFLGKVVANFAWLKRSSGKSTEMSAAKPIDPATVTQLVGGRDALGSLDVKGIISGVGSSKKDDTVPSESPAQEPQTNAGKGSSIHKPAESAQVGQLPSESAISPLGNEPDIEENAVVALAQPVGSVEATLPTIHERDESHIEPVDDNGAKRKESIVGSEEIEDIQGDDAEENEIAVPSQAPARDVLNDEAESHIVEGDEKPIELEVAEEVDSSMQKAEELADSVNQFSQELTELANRMYTVEDSMGNLEVDTKDAKQGITRLLSMQKELEGVLGDYDESEDMDMGKVEETIKSLQDELSDRKAAVGKLETDCISAVVRSKGELIGKLDELEMYGISVNQERSILRKIPDSINTFQESYVDNIVEAKKKIEILESSEQDREKYVQAITKLRQEYARNIEREILKRKESDSPIDIAQYSYLYDLNTNFPKFSNELTKSKLEIYKPSNVNDRLSEIEESINDFNIKEELTNLRNIETELKSESDKASSVDLGESIKQQMSAFNRKVEQLREKLINNFEVVDIEEDLRAEKVKTAKPIHGKQDIKEMLDELRAECEKIKSEINEKVRKAKQQNE